MQKVKLTSRVEDGQASSEERLALSKGYDATRQDYATIIASIGKLV